MRWAGAHVGEVLGEREHDAWHVLECVPPGRLQDERYIRGRRWAGAEQIDGATDPPVGAVPAGERGGLAASTPGEEADELE